MVTQNPQEKVWLSTDRKNEIDGIVRQYLLKVWARRDELISPNASDEEVVRLAPDLIVREILGYELVRVEEIPSASFNFDTAGMIDNRKRKIVISRKFPLEVRRFTTGHEIGHAVLHQGMDSLHRDRPADGGGRRDYNRPIEEQEADYFSAGLLMPRKTLTTVFTDSFGGRIVGSQVGEDFCFDLTRETGKTITPGQFAKMRAYERAMLISTLSWIGATPISRLAERFKVSRSAMAYQLLEFDLVT